MDFLHILIDCMIFFLKIQKHAIGGTVNMNGFLLIKVTHIGSKPGLSQILEILEAAHVATAPVKKVANRISRFSVTAVSNLSLKSVDTTNHGR